MTPMQRIAMGLVIVLVDPVFRSAPGYDALPDPIGWLLVLTGLFALRRLDRGFSAATWLGIVALVVSVPIWLPAVHERLDTSGAWFVSLPQILCCLLLCRQVQRVAGTDPAAKWFGLLVWGFALVGVLPVVALGGRVSALENPTVLFSWFVNLALICACFAAHRRPWLGGPGDLQR